MALRPRSTENISRKGPQSCRSLGFARDDRKERVVVKRGPLPRDRTVVEEEPVSNWPLL
jgi:hypothetical protein